ncbi:xylulokinase [Brachyspira hampsonii]|uniref:Xylulose kinase n=1 Tax=Brachyspira hampsonii 30446 TaxID=1289135 RepID=A0A2U4EXL7_9SPIR|nr:xylulokinase [Brachyspira hampsonii]EKV58015.1 xylulose kinase [Brachyspira hampsonii 30446]MBW5388832.1 xylulokinase [Brachyspira hampsonii]MBW5393746.1 xylulokinase [Brachyspira hampsonii]OEJ20595.1 xylulokinase [Brachyspira hampsonii]
MNYYIGIDLGTSSVKTLIMTSNGKTAALSQKDYDFDKPYYNFAEQDVNVWWESTVFTIKDSLNQLVKIDSNYNIKGIGFSGQMHGLVALDKNGNVLRKAILWCDSRSLKEIEYINSKIGLENIMQINHSPIAVGFLLPSLLWIKNNEPHIYKNIDKVILPKDYIRYKLTNIIASDITDAAATGVFDSNKSCWSDYIIEKLGLDKNIFPDIFYPYEVSGTITEKSSKETGLKKGIQVSYGGADQVMQAVGNGIINTNTASITIGTGGQILMPIDKPIYDKKNMASHTFNFLFPNTWYYLGAALSSGLALKWAKNNFCNAGETFKDIDLKVKDIKAGSNGIIFLPYLAGERTPYMNSNASAMFLGLTLSHDRYHILRSVMEGVVYSLKDCFMILTDDLNMECSKLIASGGGSYSDVWLQIQADILNREIYVSKTKEQAALGAAITSAVANKEYQSYEEALKNIITYNDIPITPIDENVKIYCEYYEIFKECYKRNSELMYAIKNIAY